MRRGSTVVQIFISGPSDVGSYKSAVRDAVYRWSKLHGPGQQVTLTPVMWEEDSAPAIGDTAQNTLNRQIVDDSDAMIALFATRLGTPTASAESGTVEEVERFVSAGKPVAVLFYAGSANLPQVDPAQLGRLREYRDRCKDKGLLGEFESASSLSETVDRILVDQIRKVLAAEEQSTTELPPAAPATVARDSVVDAKSAGAPNKAWEALGRGDLDDGLKLLKEQFNSEKPDVSWENTEALGLSYAYVVGGSARALTRLREVVQRAEKPTNEMKFYLGRSLERNGETEAALELLRDVARSGESFATAAFGRIVAFEIKRGAKTDALRVLREQLDAESERRRKAELLRTVGWTLREAENPEDQHQGLMLLELAHSMHPRDDDQEERLARIYVDRGDSFGLAVYHYARLLGSYAEPEAETNYGWSVSKLGLPITAVEHYRLAEKRDEPFAIANLALTLLGAGFVEEARQILDSARKRGLRHAQIDKATGAIVEQEEGERERLDETLKGVKKIRQWRVNEAQAMVDALVSAETLTGVYKADPSFAECSLTATGNGVLSGSFHFEPLRVARLWGTVVGRRFGFVWESVPPPPEPTKPDDMSFGSLLLALAPKATSGFGVLLFKTDGTAEGYFATGSGVLDEGNVGNITEWKLQRDEARTEQVKQFSDKLIKAVGTGLSRFRRIETGNPKAK